MVVFVSGGSRGIGRAVVFEALKEGHDVAFTYKSDLIEAKKVVEEANKFAPRQKCYSYQLDIKDSKKTEEVFDAILDDFGTINSVVCNAGINRNNLLFLMSNEEWQDVIDTNLTGTFYTIRQALPIFLSNGQGRFVLISSIARGGISGQANYSTTKAGLVGLSATIAKEYGSKGITSNVIAPGFFETDMTKNTLSQELRDLWMKLCPLKRVGTTEELASIILFFASEKANFINGEVINVSGGLNWVK